MGSAEKAINNTPRKVQKVQFESAKKGKRFYKIKYLQHFTTSILSQKGMKLFFFSLSKGELNKL